MTDQDKGKKPTLREVAALAGVSPMTVSRAIHGSAPVNAETKERIDAAIAQLGYVPNAAAQQLARGRGSDRVGIMIHDRTHSLWSRIVFAMQGHLVLHGFSSLVVSTHGKAEEEAEQLAYLVQQGVCGILAAPYAVDSALPRLVQQQGLPQVVLNNKFTGTFDTVAVDEAAGMKRLTQHLLAQGHRRIAMVYRTPIDFPAVERRRGFTSALQEAGLAIEPGTILETNSESGGAATLELLSRPERPTAIIAAAPWAVFGVLFALGQHRLVIPDDMEVAVFGETPSYRNLLPQASYEPAEDIAKKAAGMLVERIKGYDGPARSHVQPVKVIERAPRVKIV